MNFEIILLISTENPVAIVIEISLTSLVQFEKN